MFPHKIMENRIDKLSNTLTRYWRRNGQMQTFKKTLRGKFAKNLKIGFPVAQLVEHGVSNAKIMGSIPRESKTW